MLTLRPSDSVSIVVGYASFKPEQIAENVAAVTRAVVGRRIAQKWDNVKGIYIKGPRTISLPIWQTNQLWMNDTDVLANPEKDVEVKGTEEKVEANTSKKRKSLDGQERDKKRQKKGKASQTPSNDDKLDKQIAERKARLEKQKAKAKAAMDD
jgi:ribosome biogenesis protein UTP30